MHANMYNTGSPRQSSLARATGRKWKIDYDSCDSFRHDKFHRIDSKYIVFFTHFVNTFGSDATNYGQFDGTMTPVVYAFRLRINSSTLFEFLRRSFTLLLLVVLWLL